MDNKEDSITLQRYKYTMMHCLQLYYPNVSIEDLSEAVDYSIDKRFKNVRANVSNSYTNQRYWNTLLAWSDYIDSRQPITNAFGTMFKKKAKAPNPMNYVIQQFLKQRSIYKNKMFTFPKGTEQFARYNLLQSLEKINANGCYGTLGAPTSLLYDVNVATSVTSAGRSYISTASMFFESFLADNVKFGSLDEVIEFINHICEERPHRKYSDSEWINHYISPEECFAKVVLECGFKWLPDDKDLDIIWQIIINLDQENLNRVYYKNNLYEFCLNKKISNLIITILKKLPTPYFVSLKPPVEIQDSLLLFTDLLREYVFYNHMYIDRIIRCDNMIKEAIAVSDTDSCILTLDPWYRFVLDLIKDVDIPIGKVDPINAIYFFDKDEFGDLKNPDDICPIYFEDMDEDYDFANDEIVEVQKMINPIVYLKSDYIRYSIINIMAYVLDQLMRDYMITMAKEIHSWDPTRDCSMYMKTEFMITRLLITGAKKHYASLMTMQEGKFIPEDEQLDIKGIDILAKSTTAKSTRTALKKILLEDIFLADPIDQWTIVKHLAIFEKKIMNSIRSGSKEYYKPATIKAVTSYADPMRIQGVKGATVWNAMSNPTDPKINLEERNGVSIAKVIIDRGSIEKIKDKYPYQYEQALKLLNMEDNIDVTDKQGKPIIDDKTGKQKKKVKKIYNERIEAISIPLDTPTPDWLMELIDYNEIVRDNLNGFPYDSVGIVKMTNNTNYSNILQL